VSDWLSHRVLVSVGTGGVGKTTVSAAIGLEAARRGLRVLVLTIDPARRLADALGLAELGHDAQRIPDAVLREAGVGSQGSLSAMMLDTKRTFDELVARYAPDDEAIARIYDNPIYQNLTDALAGSREYSAMERLHQLHSQGEYDLIVLDTPPAAHALDFLDAPRRLTGFLDGQLIKLMFAPALALGRTGLRLFQFGANAVLPLIERVTGMEFLRIVAEFLLAFESMLVGFTTRAREIEALLRSPDCGFVLVVGPDRLQARRAREFWERLEAEQIRLVGLVANRVRRWPGGGTPPDLDPATCDAGTPRLAKALGECDPGLDATGAARELVRAAIHHAAAARRDAQVLSGLTASLPLDARDVRVIPLFAEDVHALAALRRMGGHVFDETRDGS
jgi:anion-transporting  ArsA/GET3 family ATPase